MGDTPVAPAESAAARKSIRDGLHAEHDLARAAELLLAEGSITYWQNPDPNKIDDAPGSLTAPVEHMTEATKMNGFDFVHLCGMLSCCKKVASHFGYAPGDLLDTKSGFRRWDGQAPIPRGYIIVAASAVFGSGSVDMYHA